jgi:SAM-dependent methyltransferase
VLPPGSSVLDLGCGTGAHATHAFMPEHHVVGVDLSLPSLRVARASLDRASFVCADIASVGFAPQSFDAALALFSLIHVPREEHASVLARIATWLRPGGWLVVTMGAGDGGEAVGDFLGVDMFWSSWDARTNVKLVGDAGLDVVTVRQETEEEHGRPVTHLWVVARRPGD